MPGLVYTVEPPITDPPTSGQPLYKGHQLWHQLELLYRASVETPHERTLLDSRQRTNCTLPTAEDSCKLKKNFAILPMTNIDCI